MRNLFTLLLATCMTSLWAAETVTLQCHFEVALEKAPYFLTLMRSYNVRNQTVLAYAKTIRLPGNEIYDWTSKLAAPEILTHDPEKQTLTFTITAESKEEATAIAENYVTICTLAMEEYTEQMRRVSSAAIEASIQREDKKLARALAAKDSPAILAERQRCVETLRDLNRQRSAVNQAIKAHTASLRLLPPEKK